MYHHLVKGTDTKENKCKRIQGQEVIIQFFESVNKKGTYYPDDKEQHKDWYEHCFLPVKEAPVVEEPGKETELNIRVNM